MAASSLTGSMEQGGALVVIATSPASCSVPCDDLAELEWLSKFCGGLFLSASNRPCSCRPPLTCRSRRPRVPIFRRPDPNGFILGLPSRAIHPLPSKSGPSAPAPIPCDWTTRLLHPPGSLPPGRALPPGHVVKEGERRWTGRSPSEVPPLRSRENSTVEDRTPGPEDAVQRVRGPLQVRQASPGVPPSGQPRNSSRRNTPTPIGR
ncbi:hypothetical protein MLD38_028910 [Melastoma candidum]|uniref:Uncharacterized protein n=1 Tax=Melastoma candidum TaxID=119954 RepID=A0ACB9N258_9MYRT|nr:hypothetical protein MLD38_028910 [Melastoma candidum]